MSIKLNKLIIFVVILIGCFVYVYIGWMGRIESTRMLVRQATVGNPQEQRMAVSKMGGRKDYYLKYIIDSYDKFNPQEKELVLTMVQAFNMRKAKEFFKSKLDKDTPYLRLFALNGFAKFAETGDVDVFIKRYHEEDSAMNKLEIVKILGTIKTQQAYDFLASLTKESDELLALAAANSLVKSGHDEFESILKSAAHSENEKVKKYYQKFVLSQSGVKASVER